MLRGRYGPKVPVWPGRSGLLSQIANCELRVTGWGSDTEDLRVTGCSRRQRGWGCTQPRGVWSQVLPVSEISPNEHNEGVMSIHEVGDDNTYPHHQQVRCQVAKEAPGQQRRRKKARRAARREYSALAPAVVVVVLPALLQDVASEQPATIIKTRTVSRCWDHNSRELRLFTYLYAACSC